MVAGEKSQTAEAVQVGDQVAVPLAACLKTGLSLFQLSWRNCNPMRRICKDGSALRDKQAS